MSGGTTYTYVSAGLRQAFDGASGALMRAAAGRNECDFSDDPPDMPCWLDPEKSPGYDEFTQELKSCGVGTESYPCKMQAPPPECIFDEGSGIQNAPCMVSNNKTRTQLPPCFDPKTGTLSSESCILGDPEPCRSDSHSKGCIETRNMAQCAGQDDQCLTSGAALRDASEQCLLENGDCLPHLQLMRDGLSLPEAPSMEQLGGTLLCTTDAGSTICNYEIDGQASDLFARVLPTHACMVSAADLTRAEESRQSCARGDLPDMHADV